MANTESVEIKSRPILFSAPMVRAILEGRKTQTRRIVKRQPTWRQDILSRGLGDPCPGVLAYQEAPGVWHHYGSNNFCEEFSPYKPGTRLWVRETWTKHIGNFGESWGYFYRASVPDEHIIPLGPWRPSIHMPREACRITLEITEVRVERLQEISDEDAIAEGLIPYRVGGFVAYKPRPEYDGGIAPVAAYRSLWESINGAGSWDLNPWAWVISFARVSQ